MDMYDGLTGKQVEAVKTIDENLEIIACAGAGKTGVVTRRVINILKSNPEIKPENIVAFTFTEKAAVELKTRIYKYGKDELGNTLGFAHMYIGTIHGFCLKTLQDYVQMFQKFTVLDEIKTKLFVDRYSEKCGMSLLGLKRFRETGLFISAVGLMNENSFAGIDWPDPLQTAMEMYRDAFYSKNYFDFSLIMKEAVSQIMQNDELRTILKEKIKYVTVDEYQDINPIQETLINQLSALGSNLCIVGDDDQTIYQFRGSDSSNILTFKERYGIGDYIVLAENFRSTSAVVDIAKKVIANNTDRLKKEMTASSKLRYRYEEGDVVYDEFRNTSDEYHFIGQRIQELHSAGVKYSEIAILLRKRKFGSDLAKILDTYGIPYIIEGVNELFVTPECNAAKLIFDYLNGAVDRNTLFNAWKSVSYPINDKDLNTAINELSKQNPADKVFYGDFVLQNIFHRFLETAFIREIEGDRASEIILYNLGKFSQVINDYETVYYTTLPKWRLVYFCSFLEYTASGYYPEGQLENIYIRPDAVNIMTVHQSKGLEFTAVFIPQLNRNNFPSSKVGGKSVWHIIDKQLIPNSSRFDGTLADERKLFYVAVTRAKKFLFLTRSPYNEREKQISTFLVEAKNSKYLFQYDSEIKYSDRLLPETDEEFAPINLNFSILQNYFECKYRFKLSLFYGFAQPIVPPLGYGKSMHEIVMNMHRSYLAGKTLDISDLDSIVEAGFYLPYANPKLRDQMLSGARKTTVDYFKKNKDDFADIIFAETDIEIDFGDNIKVNGRIDLVKRKDVDGLEKTYIVDFKTKHRDVTEEISSEQLKIYALGYRELCGETADYIEVYNLDKSEANRRRVTESLLRDVKKDIVSAAAGIRGNKLSREHDPEKCTNCYLNYLCLSREEKKKLGVE